MKQWKCSVCGYIHQGDEPPKNCPVCGADRSKFIEYDPAAETAVKQNSFGVGDIKTEPAEAASISKYDRLFDLMVRHHVHPMSVHIPNGMLPASVLFILLAALLNCIGLGQAAFYNLVFVALTMPLVLFSGYLEWQRKYNGELTRLFIIKMGCAATVTLSAAILVLWFIIDPKAANDPLYRKGPFLFVNVIMLAAAGTAGFIGGKLVFKD